MKKQNPLVPLHRTGTSGLYQCRKHLRKRETTSAPFRGSMGAGASPFFPIIPSTIHNLSSLSAVSKSPQC
ncbi:MAG: hypothetical protein KDI38_20415, partial [Calditrichaeota bacterium]|nr:hypothetical protein [Calditrichota bacterium]